MIVSSEKGPDFILKRLLPPILTGIMCGTSYIPFPPWAIFFCFLPLFIVWFEENSWRGIFWTGWLAQFVFTLIGFNWVAYTIHVFGHMPWPIAVIVLFLFCSFANLYVPFAGLTWYFFCRVLKIGPQGRVWALPIFLIIGERIYPMIFDWHFGYTWLWARFPAMHLADIVGFVGLSDIGLFFNGLFFWAWWHRRERRSWWKAVAAVPVLFLILNVWGYYRGINLEKPDAKLSFLVVQANIGNEEKLMAETGPAFRDTVINKFVSLTQQGLNVYHHADFAVWPETAFPDLIPEPTLSYGYALKLKMYIQSMHTKLITGGYSTLPATGQITNSFFVLDENGQWMTTPYHKTVLLAFGEYMPGAEWFPKLREWVPEVGNFGRGPGPTVKTAGSVKIGPMICYEPLFDWFSRKLANEGAQVLVDVTNDSWYGTWEQPYQHGYMALARAIEVRRPLVRSTNTGISAAILASGEILTLSPLHEAWFHLYEVPYVTHPQDTVFMRWGYYLIPVLLVLGLLTIALWSRRAE